MLIILSGKVQFCLFLAGKYFLQVYPPVLFILYYLVFSKYLNQHPLNMACLEYEKR